ncbi:TRAP transporter substrate-binding protein [Pseudooceanicola sp. CBS1P-1]|uniref:DctP family TRAP transporter solute-binding subunit n=1 Tax=Pseudooceanicola albus TaxID=2692189 RepID=A0A6L7GAT3_9RHOB|nr:MULTISPECIES: TRAP transporter substrate-binding protein [Pseudooceanicola]MBT9384389.1 TRAP transporter substrate-binding protein [Pseudooceanicola endophyticus]MXN19873.1 DctP family TRAP transporter solute-binding subunit [Pseudooceanicola albus]
MKIATVALCGALAALIAAPVAAKDWRGWNIHPEGYPNTIALEDFAKEVAEKTDGRIKPTVYNNAVLGDQPDAIEQVRNGGLDFANFNMGPMGQIVPETNVLSLPFIFKDVEHMHRVMDGPIGQEFSDALSSAGLVALSWFDSGSRSFYNTKHPIETPADMKGLKFRVMNNDLYVNMVDALGGNATPMAYSEVYQSLKTGVIDGAENNYPSFDSSNHYEVAKYYSVTNHLIIPECICISKATWDATPEADQEIVKTAAINAAKEQRALWAKRSEASKEEVEAAGVKVNQVKDPAAFQAAMKPVYANFLAENPELKPLVEAIQTTE